MPHMGFRPFGGVEALRFAPAMGCALHKKSPFDIPMCHVRLTFMDVTH